MPQPDPANPAPKAAGPARLIDGRLLILATALGCVVLFFIVLFSLRSVEQHVRDSQQTLLWSDRANWTAPLVIRTTMVKPNAANAQYTYNKPRYRDPGFTIPAEEEQAVLACADAARQWAQQADVLKVPSPITDTSYFYAEYLRATLLSLGDDKNTQAPKRYQLAIENAPKVLVIQYTDPNGNPVPGLKPGTIEIGCDRVTNEGTNTRSTARSGVSAPHHRRRRPCVPPGL